MTPEGKIRYANDASRPITAALGALLPRELFEALTAVLEDPRALVPEVPGDGSPTFRLKPVSIPEFGLVNLTQPASRPRRPSTSSPTRTQTLSCD